MPDIFLRAVPAGSDNANDVRLYDPTIPDVPIVLSSRIYFRGTIHDARAVKMSKKIYYVDN